MTKDQIKYVRRLLHQAGLSDEGDKIEQCLLHSNGRTESLTAMTQPETQSLINGLKEAMGQPTETSEEKMRKKIISMAHDLGWRLPGGKKIDMHSVDTWCINKSGFAKPLDALNYWELTKAVTMFSSMHEKYLKAI
jgi:hypothetical protein